MQQISLSKAHLAVTSAIFVVLATSTATAAGLVPHRAVYELEPKRIEKNSGISSISGRIAYEISGSACDGWSTTYRVANRYVRLEGNVQVTDTQLTAWEAGDGSEMRINQKYYVDNRLNSETYINVKKPVPGEDGVGTITLPTPKEFSVPKDAVFPVLHQQRLMKIAGEGQTRDVSTLFEGSDGDKIYSVVSFIGRKKEAGTEGAETGITDTKPLLAKPSWPMTISYFPADDKSAEAPLYQSSFRMYDNGVSTELVFDYGEYSLKGRLTKLEFLPVEACK
jgi:hypothetical protein